MAYPKDIREMGNMLAELQLFAQREAMTELSEALADAQLHLAMEQKFLKSASEDRVGMSSGSNAEAGDNSGA